MNADNSISSPRSSSYIALFAALLAVFGMIPKIDLPFGVPITLQTLGVMLGGCLLGPRRAFFTLLLFLLAVALGLPLLSGGRGGIGVFLAPSSGFLIGFLFGAPVTGLLMRRFHRGAGAGVFVAAFLSSLIGGVLVIYLFGIVGLALLAHMTFTQAGIAVLAFIPGDLIKCVVCALLVQNVMRAMPAWRLDRD
ncbi:MAG: biotin transporter BioY [Janthinobacterium lividum]